MAKKASTQEKTYNFSFSASTLKLVAVLVIGLFVGYLAGANMGSEATAKAGAQQLAPANNDGGAAAPAQRVQVSADDDPAIGAKNAQVTIIEFSDFECPFCGRALPTVKQVLKDYEGKVRVVYRDFPLSFHPNAQKAAEAAECADDQGKFWEYHDKLFANQQALTVDNLKQYAKDLGLDAAKFNSCLDSGKYASEVQKDMAAGSAAGVSGTPTFFIGNDENGYQMIVGAQPYAVIKAAIDAELA